jgi:hypothetical protein
MEVMMPMAPLELVVHSANIGIRRVETPDGNLTLLQMITPVGIMLSLKFDDGGIDYLMEQLTASRSGIVTPPKGIILPG